MPVGTRIRGNNVFGTTTDNPLLAGATTFNSAGLANLPVVSGNHAIITLDPLRQFGAPEIIIVTAHTAAATVATITRGAYDTVERQHPQGTVWTHAPVTEDVIPILTSSTRPSDPYRGEKIFETDTNRYIGRSTADVWQQEGLFFDPPSCRIFHNTTQSCADATETFIVFNSERWDTDSMHSTSVNTGRITFNTGGLYILEFHGILPPLTTYVQYYTYFRLNGTTSLGYHTHTPTAANVGPTLFNSTVYKFVPGDYVEIAVFQDNTANTAQNLQSANSYSPEASATWIGRGN